LRPDVLLVIDEAKGRRAAVQRQIPIVGILGILDAAAALGWVNLTDVLGRLQGTSFRITPDVIASLLERDSRRKK
jgi:predicted nucleic acid-binding protein